VAEAGKKRLFFVGFWEVWKTLRNRFPLPSPWDTRSLPGSPLWSVRLMVVQ